MSECAGSGGAAWASVGPRSGRRERAQGSYLGNASWNLFNPGMDYETCVQSTEFLDKDRILVGLLILKSVTLSKKIFLVTHTRTRTGLRQAYGI